MFQLSPYLVYLIKNKAQHEPIPFDLDVYEFCNIHYNENYDFFWWRFDAPKYENSAQLDWLLESFPRRLIVSDGDDFNEFTIWTSGLESIWCKWLLLEDFIYREHQKNNPLTTWQKLVKWWNQGGRPYIDNNTFFEIERKVTMESYEYTNDARRAGKNI